MICLTFSTLAFAGAPPAHPEMHLFLAMAREARDATIRGDLDTARQQMEAIHGMPSLGAFPDAMQPHLVALRSAAEAGASGATAEDLGRAVSRMAAACGGCHTAASGPKFDKVKGPPKEKDLATHMQIHAWAANRMWESLVVGDQKRWQAGAQALYQESWIHSKAYAESSTFARQVHETGEAAMLVSTDAEKVALYGQFVAACAGCHTQVAEKAGVAPTEEAEE